MDFYGLIYPWKVFKSAMLSWFWFMFMVFWWVCDYELLVVFAAGCWHFLCVCGVYSTFSFSISVYTQKKFGSLECSKVLAALLHLVILWYYKKPCNGHMAIVYYYYLANIITISVLFLVVYYYKELLLLYYYYYSVLLLFSKHYII